ALILAQELAHPLTLSWAPGVAARLYQLRREAEVAQKQTEACMALSAEHGFAYWLTTATTLRGWTLAAQGRRAEGLAQLRQGLDACGAMGAALVRPYFFALLAEVYGNEGQSEEGLRMLSEALAAMEKTGERFYAAECYRLKGELLLRVSTGEQEAE